MGNHISVPVIDAHKQNRAKYLFLAHAFTKIYNIIIKQYYNLKVKRQALRLIWRYALIMYKLSF